MPRQSRRASKRSIRKVESRTSTTLGEIADIAGKALQIGEFVASVVNVELKYVDTQADNVILAPGTATLDQFDLPTAINAGVEFNERTGRSILAHSLQFQGYLKLIDTGSTPLALGFTREARLMVIMDTGLPNSDQPSSGSESLQLQDILQYVTDPDDTVVSPQDYDNQQRYYKLHDSKYEFTVGDTLTHFFKEYIPLEGIHITYTGESSINLNQNNIYLFAFTDEDTSESDIVITYSSRFAFYDN